MTAETQGSPKIDLGQKELVDQLFRTISQGRLSTYLPFSGHNPSRALQLYLWNAQVGEAFHVLIQAVEVALRNKVNHGLTATFGEKWWEDAAFMGVADDERQADLVQVKKRIRNRNLPLCTGQVVAGLSFGFWAGMLQAQYNPTIWGAQLRPCFPDLPTTLSRKVLAREVNKIATLRNRISHHEPIIKRNLSEDHHNVCQMLKWLCPTKAAWVMPYCRVPALLREKP